MHKWRLAAFIFGFACAAGHADTIYLTNGNSLEGRVRYEGDKVIIEQENGEVTLDKSRVDYVEQKKTLMDEFDDRFKALAAKENVRAEEFVALGTYATDKKMTRLAEKAYRKAVELDPQNAAARVALGYVKFDGQWMKADDANRARGLVQFDGEWVTPEAKSDLLKLKAQADIAAAKAETERLKLERMERALELVEAERDRDVYYGPRYGGYYSGPVIIPSQLCKKGNCPPQPSTTRPLGVAESIFSQGNSGMK